MWSAGCIFGAIIYQFTPLFDGTDEDEQQIVEVVKVLGTAGFIEWVASLGEMLTAF